VENGVERAGTEPITVTPELFGQLDPADGRFVCVVQDMDSDETQKELTNETTSASR
jgi:hypothetical protein